MKTGTKVWVCHDGKWSRRVQGVVQQQHNGHHITVEFPLGEQNVVAKFRKDNAIRYRKNKPPSYFIYGKRPARYSGWADVDYFAPWFAIYKMKD